MLSSAYRSWNQRNQEHKASAAAGPLFKTDACGVPAHVPVCLAFVAQSMRLIIGSALAMGSQGHKPHTVHSWREVAQQVRRLQRASSQVHLSRRGI